MEPLQDGVTQYQLDWHSSPLPACDFLPQLEAWRSRFHARGGIGQDPGRYGGVGFGNVSGRLECETFIISGTQTGHLGVLEPRHYSHVLECDVAANRVRAGGPHAPSSEAMTHAMIYHCVPSARFVMHLHAPALWHAAGRLGIPVTPAEVGYGTPAMATAVATLIARYGCNVVAMGGHEDGILGWGADADLLGSQLCRLLDEAAVSPV